MGACEARALRTRVSTLPTLSIRAFASEPAGKKRLFCSLIKSSLKSFIIDGGYAVFSKLELLNQTYFTFLAYHCIRGFMWFRRPRGTQYTLMSYSY